MTDTTKILPKLRFPEFENVGEWKVVKLGDVVTFCNSKCDRSELKIETYISTENILQDFLGVKRAVNLPQNGSFTRFCIGDILVSNIRPYLKKIWQADFEGAASNDVLVFRTKDQINDKYVAHLLKSDAFVNYCMEGVKGVKMPRGDKALMLEYSIPFPSLPEQQKIAAFLTSLDEQISAHTKKLEALKAHKKGLMQQLFPANGEKTPKLRFPEFKNAGEWKEVKVSDIFIVTRGIVLAANRTHKTPDTQYKYPVYSSQTTNNGLMGYYDEYLYKNAITWTTDGANAGTVFFREGEFYCTNVCGVLLNDNGYANKCIAEIIGMKAKQYVSYVGNPKLMNNVMADISIDIPPLAEQQKIASFLTSIDEMIQAQDDKIRKLKTYKNGLMQQMFPQNK